MAVAFGTFNADAFHEFGLGIVVVAIGLASSLVAAVAVVVGRRGEKGTDR